MNAARGRWARLPGPGWAATTIDRALWQAGALGLALWLLALGGVVAWRSPRAAAALLAVHVAAAMFAVVAVALEGRQGQIIRRSACFATALALMSMDLVVADSALPVAVICMTFAVAVATSFLVLPWWPALAVWCFGTATAVIAVLVDGGPGRVALAVAASAAGYTVAGMVFIGVVRVSADQVDAEAGVAAAELERVVAARAAAQTAAEYSRTLHDTMVNTLRAIASGAAGVVDHATVRRRCLHDVAAIRRLITVPGRPAAGAALEGVASGLGLDVEWSGLATPDRHTLEARVSPHRRAALRGIVRELLLNVEKHAGVTRAVVDVRAERTVAIITVADDGHGFDVARSSGTGLRSSVAGRADEVGIGVEVVSAPGAGTQVRIECPLGADDSVRPGADVFSEQGEIEELTVRVGRTAAWAWSFLVAVVSLLLAVVGASAASTFGAAVLVLASCLASWWCCRGGRDLPRWLAVVVGCALPAGFMLNAIGAAGGRGPEFWPAIGLAPLFVVLLFMAPSRRFLVLPTVGLALAAVLAELTWVTASMPTGVAFANALIHGTELIVWCVFARVLSRIGRRAATERRAVLRQRAERASLDAAVVTQQRWQHARLEAAVELLGGIADGSLSALDPAVQRLAADEEHSLRQLLMMGPHLVYLGPWLATGLATCLTKGIRLHLRVGEHDLPDATAAAALGRTLLGFLGVLQPGAEATVASFEDDTRAWYTVVGPAGFARRYTAAVGSVGEIASNIKVTTLPAYDLVEIQI